MTAEQYWDGDCTLVIGYRKAHQLRQEELNHYAWLQGLYVYKAVGSLAPIFHTFAKKGTKPDPYLENPIPLTRKDQEDVEERKAKQVMEKGKANMLAFMASHNEKFKQKEGG